MKKNIRKSKITIIDDEKDLISLMKLYLESENFAISFAYDGRSGLDIIRREKPDLIILDINMPDMDGRDVLVELKKNKEIKDIPVIMLTARDDEIDKDYSMKLGACEYVAKPIYGHILLKRIKKILGRDKEN